MVLGRKKKKSKENGLSLSSIQSPSHKRMSSRKLSVDIKKSPSTFKKKKSPKRIRKSPRHKKRLSAIQLHNHEKYKVKHESGVPEGFMMDSSVINPDLSSNQHQSIQSPTYSFQSPRISSTRERTVKSTPSSPKLQIINPSNRKYSTKTKKKSPHYASTNNPLSFLNFSDDRKEEKKQLPHQSFSQLKEVQTTPVKVDSKGIIVTMPKISESSTLPFLTDHSQPDEKYTEEKTEVAPKAQSDNHSSKPLPILQRNLPKNDSSNHNDPQLKYQNFKKEKPEHHIKISIDDKGNPLKKKVETPLTPKKEVDTRLEKSFHTLFDNIFDELKDQWNSLDNPQTERDSFLKRFQNEKSIRSYRIVQEIMDAHLNIIKNRKLLQEAMEKRDKLVVYVNELLDAYHSKQFPSYKVLLYQLFKTLTAIETLNFDILKSIEKERSLIYHIQDEPPSSRYTSYMDKMQVDLKRFENHPLSLFFSKRLSISTPSEFIKFCEESIEHIEDKNEFDDEKSTLAVEKQFELKPLTKHKIVEAKRLYNLFLDEDLYKMKRLYGVPYERLVFTNVAAKNMEDLHTLKENMLSTTAIPQRFKDASLAIQLAWKQRIARRVVSQRKYEIRCREDAARVIQAAFKIAVAKKKTSRLYQQEMQQRNYFLKREAAVIAIQRAYRSYIFRKEINYRAKRRFQSKAIITLQNTCRRYLAKRYVNRYRALKEEQKKRFERENKAAVTIQTAVRAWLIRYKPTYWEWLMPRVRAVRKLQRWYRVLKAQLVIDILKSNLEFELMQEAQAEEAAIKIQSWWRGHWTRLELTTERQYERLVENSAVKIQKAFRQHVFMKKRIRAVERIQRHVPFFMARAYFLDLKKRDSEIKKRTSLITLTQSRIRTINQMKETHDFAKLTHAAIQTQCQLRHRACHAQCEHDLERVLLIQCIMRQKIYAKEGRHSTASEVLIYADTLFGPDHSIKQWAALLIQTNVRVWLAKRKRDRRQLELAAIVVQRKMRQQLALLWAYKLKKNMMEQQHIIDNHYFTLSRVLAYKTQFDLINIIQCQRVCRIRLREYKNAMTIQCFVRQFISRRRVHRLKKQALYELRTYLSRERAQYRAKKKKKMSSFIFSPSTPKSSSTSSMISPILNHTPIVSPTFHSPSLPLYPSTQLPFSPAHKKTSLHRGYSLSDSLSFQPSPSPSHNQPDKSST
mmetsp:Transcript_4975/g.7373  ORF Transcript_4975/g.7373 Transcript_4975/m.7373 type:complete len:1187 (-) Transcript_4975:38-3598(-)